MVCHGAGQGWGAEAPPPATGNCYNEGRMPQLERLQLKIGGMSCSFCSSTIEKAYRRMEGVEEVHVSLAHGGNVARPPRAMGHMGHARNRARGRLHRPGRRALPRYARPPRLSDPGLLRGLDLRHDLPHPLVVCRKVGADPRLPFGVSLGGRSFWGAALWV